MERYLKRETLEAALSDNPNLPSVEQLSELITQAEVELLVSGDSVSEDLLKVAWYLFTIASLRDSLDIYGVLRVRSAYQISGHILDLKISNGELPDDLLISYTFAAQISYLRSSLQPNSIALFKKNIRNLPTFELNTKNLKIMSHYAGVALLGFEVGYIYKITSGVEDFIEQKIRSWKIEDFYKTPFGASASLLLGSRYFISALVYGHEDSLRQAKELFYISVNSVSSYEDSLCKWMSSLILRTMDEVFESSPWKVLPESVPVNVKRAFTLGSPRVLCLWPPQVDYLGSGDPFDQNIKFQFISTPTSGGKTLLAQLIIANHLSEDFTSACYIAPTRSLCREVEQSLSSRFRYLNLKAKYVEELEDIGLSEDDINEPTVHIMTPESLNSRFRAENNSILDSCKLYVFDEVHSVGDRGRGWVLEEVITLMKDLSDIKRIRIALISAVIGNRTHFINWLGANGSTVLDTHSDWRGPRRLNAIWKTKVKDWQNIVKTEGMQVRSNSRFKERRYFELFGSLTIKKNASAELIELDTLDSIGLLSMKMPIDPETDTWERDGSHSLKHNESILPLIELLSPRGPILCIESTKAKAVSLANTIAATREESSEVETVELASFIESKLSADHPLSRAVKKGVAYHHGSLPGDVKSEIEIAVENGVLDVLVATTTMTEGVNLPVQAVIISSVGSYQSDDEFIEIVKGPKMANAIGRAGRATQETEGCVVLVHNGDVNSETFKALDPDDQDKYISSNLLSLDVLTEIEEYENIKAQGYDAIMEYSGEVLSNFFSFLWFYLYYRQQHLSTSALEDLNRYISNSMFWVQATDTKKEKILNLMNDLYSRYSSATPVERRLYGTSSSKINSTKILKAVFDRIKNSLTSDKSEIELIKEILNEGTVLELLTISEAPDKQIYNRRGGRNRELIAIDLIEFIEDWVSGKEFPYLANKYLSSISDVDFRYEQLGEFVTSYCDNFFPWVIRLFIKWANSERNEGLLSKHTPGLVQYGVPNKTALLAMSQGVFSRSLAIKLSAWKQVSYPSEHPFRLRALLQNYEITSLVSMLNLTFLELRNLLSFFKQERVKLLSRLNQYGICELGIWSNTLVQDGYCELAEVSISNNIQILQNDLVVGQIPTKFHAEVEQIVESGLPIKLTIHSSGQFLKLEVDNFIF